VPSGSTEPDESNAQSRNVHDDEKSAVGGTLPGGWSEVGSTIDHIVALSEAAFVVAVMCPYVPAGTGAAESAHALQMRPPSRVQPVARVVTEASGVQAVVVADLSAQ